MPPKHNNCKIEINIEDLIKETDSAAQRTRWTTIVLVIATVIIGIGFYNSTYWSFAFERLKALKSFENTPANNLADSPDKPLLDSYFGENDFKDTQFKVGIVELSREIKYDGLRKFLCEDIYKQFRKPDKSKDTNNDQSKDTDKIDKIALGKYLYDNFNSKTQELLDSECKYDENRSKEFVFKDETNFRILTSDLNRILNDKYLYKRERFSSIFSNENPNQIAISDEDKKNPAIKANREELQNLLDAWTANTEELKPPTNTNSSNQQSNTKKANSSVNKSNSLANNSNLPTSDSNLQTKPDLPTSNSNSQTKSDKVALETLRKEVNIVRFNRLLLEAAFPDEIRPSKDIIPSSESLMAKELSKHFAFDDKVQFIEIPFSGNAIDVNDLGVFGGISLIIILLLLRFSLSREIKNLNFSFKQAFFHKKLDNFYHLLAIRQVLTIPEMAGETKNQTLSVCTKWICLLPLIVISFCVYYDFYSISYYGVYEWNFVLTHLTAESICVVFILWLSLRCLERQIHIDEIWEDYDKILDYYKENNPSPKIDNPIGENMGTENTGGENVPSEFCKTIVEIPEELLNKAFKNQSKKDFDNSTVTEKDKKVIDIVQRRFAEVPPPDKNLFVSLFSLRHLARLIPSKRLAAWMAREKQTNEPKNQAPPAETEFLKITQDKNGETIIRFLPNKTVVVKVLKKIYSKRWKGEQKPRRKIVKRK